MEFFGFETNYHFTTDKKNVLGENKFSTEIKRDQ